MTLPPLHPRCRCVISYRESPLTSPESNVNVRPRGLAAGNEIYFNEGGKSPYKIGEIDFKDAAQVKRVLEWSEAQIVTAPVENAIIITAAGEIYHCTGDLNTLDSIVELGEKLNGAIVTHNHPIGSANEYSFSDGDIKLFQWFKLARLRGIDELFIYELNRNPINLNTNNFSYEELLSDPEGLLWRHINVMEFARENKLTYRRWQR